MLPLRKNTNTKQKLITQKRPQKIKAFPHMQTEFNDIFNENENYCRFQDLCYCTMTF